MSDGFAEMITRANDFFNRLRANNTREFYEAHKAMYTSRIKAPAERLADLFAEDLARHTGLAHRSKLFRIHRDVRFSRDKTPYNTHLHLMWSRPGDDAAPTWFFGASPDYLILGTGLMALEKDSLTAYRALVDARGDELATSLRAARAGVGATLGDWGPDPLKRVPKPYDPDHPHGDLLRRKSLALTAPLPDGWDSAGLLASLNVLVPALLPVWAILNGAADAGG